MSKKQPTTRDEIDIKDKLEGKIETVIKNLQALAKKYPGAEVDVYTDYQYGESYAAARLEFVRPMTKIEIERDTWEEKARTLSALEREAVAFERNNQPYPRADEIDSLRRELGFFAMAPSRATLVIFNGEIVAHEMRRAVRRDGTVVLRMLGMDSPALKAMEDKEDERYRQYLTS